MPRISRAPRFAELQLRHYYLNAVIDKLTNGTVEIAQLPGVFDVEQATFYSWLSGAIPVPAWIVPLAQHAYRIAPPPAPRPWWRRLFRLA